MAEERLSKRPRLESEAPTASSIRAKRTAFLSSLSRPISPPNAPKEDSQAVQDPATTKGVNLVTSAYPAAAEGQVTTERQVEDQSPVKIASPFQLTRVRGLPTQDNFDTVSLHSILGDPLIKEAWIFNFCFDVNWTMQHFDADVRQLIKVKIVHGSWKREDGNRQGIEEALKIWKNVEDVRAYLPDAFGTHHSKMIILFKHDDTARVIIHTANMLEKDWEHMTQAVWKSPALPLLNETGESDHDDEHLGSGSRFKFDLLRYIKAYGNKLRALHNELSRFNFSQVRAALIASTPSHAKVSDPADKVWGHLSLRNILKELASDKTHSTSHPNRSHLISQVSSIATLAQAYLQETVYKAVSPASTSVIYPTPSDLRSALTGYATGGSIHTKVSSAAHQKQVALLRPQLHRWGAQSLNTALRAGRHMIPPHIKTYINFTSEPSLENPTPDINWALLTSSNLSQQAWGTIPRLPKNEKNQDEAVVHVQSFEIGVLVWPELFADESASNLKDADKSKKRNVRMIPVFGKDMPETTNTIKSKSKNELLVGLRMPYDLPLVPYGPNEMPWSPNENYTEPDRLGRMW